MCKKHSFLVDKRGEIYHGFGVVESHTLISEINNIDEDKCNKYEYDPNNNNKQDYGILGLTIDNEIFNPNKTIIDKIEKYIKKMFPDIESWNNYSNFDITIELLTELANDPEYSVRCAVAKNPKATIELLTKLSNDPDWYVRWAIVENPKVTTKLLTKLANDPNCSVRRAVAENSKVTTKLLTKLANDPNCSVRRAVAENPKTITELLTKLSNDPKGRVRCAVFENPNYKK
jgi:hypothetical protein